MGQRDLQRCASERETSKERSISDTPRARVPYLFFVFKNISDEEIEAFNRMIDEMLMEEKVDEEENSDSELE